MQYEAHIGTTSRGCHVIRTPHETYRHAFFLCSPGHGLRACGRALHTWHAAKTRERAQTPRRVGVDTRPIPTYMGHWTYDEVGEALKIMEQHRRDCDDKAVAMDQGGD